MLLEKAVEYARDVMSGQEITTSEVKIQCQWFLNDLEVNQHEELFFYYFDENKLKVIENLLKLLNFAKGYKKGQSIYMGLENFQCFFLANVFGWRFKGNPLRFRYRDIYMFIPRKNAKSFLAAIIVILLMLTEQGYSENYSICKNRDLAGEIKKAISQVLASSPLVSKHFKVPTTLTGKIVCKLTNSFYQARTASPTSNNSVNPSCMIADEIGAFKETSNIDALKSGQLSVLNPLRLYLTTAYAEDHSIFFDELDYIRRVFNEQVDDDRMFALLYYADEENLWTERGLYMSNPLRIEENYNEIRDNRKLAIDKPSAREEYLTKNMNHFVPSITTEGYVDVQDLQKCKVDVIDWTGRDVYVAVDLSISNDNTSSAMTAYDRERDLILGTAIAFIPEGRIEQKCRLERLNYKKFIEEKICIACGDLTIDYKVVEQYVFDIEKTYKVHVLGIYFDVYNCISSAQKWDREYVTTQVRQHSDTLHQPTKLLYEYIVNGKFRYTENKLLEVNFQNARCTFDTTERRYVNKKRSRGKVDEVVALINSVYGLQQHELLADDQLFVQVL